MKDSQPIEWYPLCLLYSMYPNISEYSYTGKMKRSTGAVKHNIVLVQYRIECYSTAMLSTVLCRAVHHRAVPTLLIPLRSFDLIMRTIHCSFLIISEGSYLCPISSSNLLYLPILISNVLNISAL